MTTMTMDRGRWDSGWQPRWATVEHGGVVAALVAGLLAAWITVALVTALLAAPVQTMTTFDTKGAWGLSDAVRHGSAVMLGVTTSTTQGTRTR